MNLSVIACEFLRPYLKQMIPHSPHKITLLDSSAPLPENGFDAILLLCGAQAIPEEGLFSSLPLVIPRVHNSIALLLGGAQLYHNLFEKFAGQLCWLPAGTHTPVFTASEKDCSCICSLVDTELGLCDPAIQTLILAQKNEWDTLCEICDLSLLHRLLQGDWQKEDILYLPAKTQINLSYQKDLFSPE